MSHDPDFDWFHDNHALFLWTDKQITDARREYPCASRGSTWQEIPIGSGVYFLFSGRQLAYVGQSTQLRKRLYRHGFPSPAKRPVEWLTDYVIIDVPPPYLETVESFFIHLLEPPLNTLYRLCPEAAKYLEANDE